VLLQRALNFGLTPTFISTSAGPCIQPQPKARSVTMLYLYPSCRIAWYDLRTGPSQTRAHDGQIPQIRKRRRIPQEKSGQPVVPIPHIISPCGNWVTQAQSLFPTYCRVLR